MGRGQIGFAWRSGRSDRSFGFGLAAVTEEDFESSFGGVGMEEALAVLGIHVGGVQLVAGLA